MQGFFLQFDVDKALWSFELLIAPISVSFNRSQRQGTVSKEQPGGFADSASPAFFCLPESNLMNVIKVRKPYLVHTGFFICKQKPWYLNLALSMVLGVDKTLA